MQVTSLVIGDPHFKTSNVKEVNMLIEKIVEKAQKLKPTFIVCLGDILDTHEKIDVTPFKLACEFLYKLTLIAPTYLLIGNHDYKNNQQFLTDNHAFNSLKLWDNMHVIDKVTIEEYNDMQFLFMPYVPTGKFSLALNQSGLMWETVNCIFAHQEFAGCSMGSITSNEGDIWDESFPQVISGHIHDHQILNNIFYTGSILQHGFGDNSKKYLWQFEFHTEEPLKHKKFDLGMRKKKLVPIDLDDVKTFKFDTEADYKLNVRGNEEHLKSFRSSKLCRDLKEKGVKFVYSPVLKAHELKELKKGEVNFKNKTYIAIFRDLSNKESDLVKELCKKVTSEFMEVASSSVVSPDLEFEDENVIVGENDDGEDSCSFISSVESDEGEKEEINWESESSSD